MCLRSFGPLALAIALTGCVNTPEKIIPCVTTVDHVNFTDVEKLRAFVNEAIPMGSGADCGRKVLAGKYMRIEGPEINKHYGTTNYGFHETNRSAYVRPWYWITLGYNRKVVSLTYKNNKLIRRAIP